MDSDELKELLGTLHACSDAVEWSSGKSLVEAWEQSERADWMLWLCGRMCGTEGWPTRQEVVICACRCAERVFPMYKKKYPNDVRLWKAIEDSRAWADGTVKIDGMQVVQKAVRAYAYAVDPYRPSCDTRAYSSYVYAAYAAYAATAARAVFPGRDNNHADAYTAYSNVLDAAHDAMVAAAYADEMSVLKEMSNLIRKELSIP